MKLRRTFNPKLLEHLKCPRCLEPLSEDTIELTKMGMIICQNIPENTDIFDNKYKEQCLKELSLTYCEGCRKIFITKTEDTGGDSNFYVRKMVGMKVSGVRCHICANGKLSSKFQRTVPHTRQVRFDGSGKVIIKPLEKPQDIMGELVRQWDKNSQFTTDMIGQGKHDTSRLTHIPEEFWKSDAVLTGHDEPLSQPHCERCSEVLMKLPDGSMVTDYSYVCPKCGDYFNVAPPPQHLCDQCNEVLTKLPDSVVDYTHACPQCDEFFRFIDAGGQEPHSGTTNAPLPQA